LRRKFARFSLRIQAVAKHTDRTEFHRSRELTATSFAGANVLLFHGLNSPLGRTRKADCSILADLIPFGTTEAPVLHRFTAPTERTPSGNRPAPNGPSDPGNDEPWRLGGLRSRVLVFAVRGSKFGVRGSVS